MKTPKIAAALGLAFLAGPLCLAQPTSNPPPKSWVDPDTGHRVVRVTDEPGSASLYFNVNGFTPDGKQMIYTTADTISVIDLATMKTRPVVRDRVRLVEVGRKTPTIYYLKGGEGSATTLYGTNIDTGATRKIADLPPRGGISAINADETLGAGTRIATEQTSAYGPPAARAGVTPAGGALETPSNKYTMMAARLAQRLPMELYTVDLRTGETKVILKNNDWLNHLQFSPADPTRLLYCHEGPWEVVDRIWTIRTDGSENTLVHRRTMGMEATGHEFWSFDGKTVYYDLHRPWGRVIDLASYNVETGERIWYDLPISEWSIHYNATRDNTLFCGDGSDNPPAWWASSVNKWIFLFRPERINDATADERIYGPGARALSPPEKDLVHPGMLHSERLVNMAKHDYRLEPNPIFSPDKKWIFFRSNILGPTYVFAVEVAKADAKL
ncbi:MAG TPA: oligogalacturonate lyase family protein [Opitutaceae bacterium]|nr:oligogalacturonate lyase family protein [Opitutaceae bacterium]